MPDVIVPQAPAFVRVAGVELIQAGTWNLSTGPTTFTVDDLYSAVAALECPAVRRPILKLGHDGNHGQGEACLGYIDHMAVADNGMTLIGDYAGMPAWLADQTSDGDSVLASALPDRSIEGEFDFRCGLGHTHPFVVLAVALLGVDMPGVSTLASLQGIADAYGVQVAASKLPEPTGTRVVVTATNQETPMPNPRPAQVTATVTSTDITRAFYNSPMGESWDRWIVQLELEPLGVIYSDDESGSYFYVPVTLGSGDGTEAVEFGEPQERVMQFAPKQAAAAAGRPPIRFATKAESRPDAPPAASLEAPHSPAVTPASGPSQPGEEPVVAFSDEQLITLRQRLGIAEDADEATILAALDEALEERAEPPAAVPTQSTPTTEVPTGMTLVESDVLNELQVAARSGAEARAQQLREDRDRSLEAAIGDGRITPARREHWAQSWDADPEGARLTLASLPAGLVPVGTAPGYTGGDTAIIDDTWFAGIPVPATASLEG